MNNLRPLFYIFIFAFLAFNFKFIPDSFAFDIERLKICFLDGDYKQAIKEGERLLAKESDAASSDELYYLLGLSYLKDGNLLRASDIFVIILEEFKQSKFKEEALLSLGDSYFLRGDFLKAKAYYQELILQNPKSGLRPETICRLSEVSFKMGELEQGREYLEELKEEYPDYPPIKIDKDICILPDSASDVYYSIQVGSFANSINAKNLRDKLVKSGYVVFINEAGQYGKKSYRVQVGKLKTQAEALKLKEKLSREGYPTKICP